ncbi:MAG: LemA family protein [Bacilli bacterium]|nr:LemA family protein [Bacilli bacterium]
MESLLIVIFIIIVIICTIAIFYAIIYNKFQDYIIRINEVENMIDNNLRNKYDLINRVIPIIKSNIKKEKEIFGEIIKLRSRKIGNFELYRVLMRASNELNTLKEEFPDIEKSEEIKKIRKEIKEIDTKIDNEVDYYNDNITSYNTLIKKFPSNIISIFWKYKEKLFFDRKNMNDEDYEDFKL